MAGKSRIGNLLLRKEIIDKQILEKALMIQAEDQENPRPMDAVLVYDLGIAHDKVYGALADFYAFRSMQIKVNNVDENQLKSSKEILSNFPEDLRSKLLFKKVLPYQYADANKNSLMVLAANVTEKIVEQIPLKSKFKKYEVLYCPLKTIEELIHMIAPQKNEFLDLLQENAQELETVEQDKDSGLNQYALDDEVNKSLLVNLFEGCLIEGVRKGASDIHIIPAGRSVVDIYFRIDGKLSLWHRQENTAPEAISSVVKDRSNGIDRFERDTAQDGFAQRLIDSFLIRFRVSILPITSAEYEKKMESIVIRIVDDRNVITDLQKLGLQEQAALDFKKAVGKSKGMILLTGPTGSGKSTTLMAALHYVLNPSINVLTCEDPVEYVIRGARQIKIGSKLSFDDAIRAILRHDPDVVMVGEIRDSVTAEVAVKLSNTGHLTFSTLHTNDAPSVVSRLYKMGIEPFLLANVINIIIAQRLIRRLCQHCKTPLSPEKYQAAYDFGLTEEDIKSGNIYEAGNGCKHCNNGYKGRVNICEALYFSDNIRRAIIASGKEIDENKIREIAVSNGMLTLFHSGLDRIRNGQSTIEEVAYATSGD